MKKSNKNTLLVIILIVLILISICISLIFILKNSNKESTYFEDEELIIQETFKEENKVQLIEMKEEYFNVEKCIDKYLTYSNELLYDSPYVTGDYLEEIKEKLPSIMPEFVKQKLNLQNEEEYKKVVMPDKFIRIDKVYKTMQTIDYNTDYIETNIYAYMVNGYLIDRNSKEKETLELIVLIDTLNSTFYIIPQQYIEQEKLNIEINTNFQIYNEKEIPYNKYNILDLSSVTEEDMSKEYFNRVRMNVTYDLEYIYNILNEEYRQKRFGNYDGFKKYINNNEQELKTIKFTQYLVNYYDDYTEYVCKDQYQNLYIFNEKTPMNFELKLDTYTIPTEKFKNTYATANEQQKVMMNIDKWLQMLNNRDYKTAYKLLDETYRNNNFGSEENFEKYMKEKYPSHYNIEFSTFSRETNNIYVQNIKLVDINSNEKKEQVIIMQLNEGTDFVMSFEVK